MACRYLPIMENHSVAHSHFHQTPFLGGGGGFSLTARCLVDYRREVERMGRLRSQALERQLPWDENYQKVAKEFNILINHQIPSMLDAYNEGIHAVHNSPTGDIYVNGKSVNKNAMRHGYISPHGPEFATIAAAVGSRFTQTHKAVAKWLVVADNVAISEAALLDGNAHEVDLWMLGSLNVSILVNISHLHASRFTMTPVGQLLYPVPDRATDQHDVVVFDIYSLRDYPRALNMLCAFAEIIRDRLRQGGTMLMMVPAPRRAGDLYWIVLRYILVSNFRFFDIHPELDVPTNTVPTFSIIATEALPGRRTPQSDQLQVLRTKLLMGERVGDIYKPWDHSSLSFVPSLINAADEENEYDKKIQAAYETMTSVIKSISTKTARLLKLSLPRIRPLPQQDYPIPIELLGEDMNAHMQLSWRDAALDTSPHSDIPVSLPEKRMRYIEDSRDYEPRCHWGQLKLLASEWDFLNTCRDELGGRPMMMVYAGSADGMHIPVLADLFPETKIHAYDGRPFHATMHRHARIRVFEGRDGYVTDDTIPHILATARRAMGPRDALIFISDIRGSRTDNVSVHSDMMSQARWCGMLGAERMLLKFRLPYPRPDGSTDIPSALPTDFRSVIRNTATTKSKIGHPSYLYLQGEVLPQIFAPMYSTETRLLVRPPLRLEDYDPVSYEQQLNYYNVKTRRTSHPSNPPLDLYIPGHDRGHESAMLYRIVHNYLLRQDIRYISSTFPPSKMPPNAKKGVDEPIMMKMAARLLFQVEKRLQEASGQLTRTLVTCSERTFHEYSTDLRRKFLTKGKADEYEDFIRPKVTSWKALLSKQRQQMLSIAVKRMTENAVQDGIMTDAEAKGWLEKISGSLVSPLESHDQHTVPE